MQRSYTIDIEPFSYSSAEFLEITDFEGDTPRAWLEEQFMDITDDGEAWLEEQYMDITDDGGVIHEDLLEEHLIDITDDEGDFSEAWPEEHLIDITDDEADIPEAWLEEHLIDTTDDEGDIPEVWLEEHLTDITDDVGIHIREAWLEENFTATIDDVDIPEANRDIVPLLDASFLDQVVLLPTQQPFEDNSTRKVSIPEWIFLIINVLIELLSAAFDQLSSVNKPRYTLIAMLMSVVAVITCIIELAYKAGNERVIWRQVALVLLFISKSQAFWYFP
ncbi:hypothetical protein REPUB_Repub06bG0156000 [Reevesia pubescens]